MPRDRFRRTDTAILIERDTPARTTDRKLILRNEFFFFNFFFNLIFLSPQTMATLRCSSIGIGDKCVCWWKLCDNDEDDYVIPLRKMCVEEVETAIDDGELRAVTVYYYCTRARGNRKKIKYRSVSARDAVICTF